MALVANEERVFILRCAYLVVGFLTFPDQILAAYNLLICIYSCVGHKGMALRSSRQPRVTSLRMADPLYEDDSDGEVAKKAASNASRKGGVSDSMRAKLLKENQALGGDPDAPSINFALVIGGLIASLLVLGNLIGAI